MNIQQIRTFYWVVKLGGFRRAAEQLHTSQPAVSARISTLEASVGTTLLDRGARGVQLTRDGHDFLEYAEQFLTMTDAMNRRFSAPSSQVGTLRLGVSETIVHSWLSRFLAAFRTRYPRIDVDIQVDVTTNLREALLTRALDLACLMGPVSDYTVTNIDLPAVELAWLVSADDSADAKSLEDHIRQKPVVTFARTTRPFRELRDHLSQRFGNAVRLFPSSSLSAGYEMIRDSVAIGALPLDLAAPYLARKELRVINADWTPQALQFTASFIADPPDHVVETAAQLAARMAKASG